MEKYFKVNAGGMYFEDATVNGTEDISWEEQRYLIAPRMPLMVYDEKEMEHRWQFEIDLESGNIINWPKGTTASTYYKVRDEGSYALLDENHNVIHEACCYVPKILAYLDKEQHYGFGDYIILSIDADGHLKDFPQGDELKKLLDDFINTKSF
jgi:hypothetical protein